MYTKIYDEEYHRKFLLRAKTDLGKKIYAERWAMVVRYCHGELTLLDYGCASGAFHQSNTNGFKTFGYDVNPNCGHTVYPRQEIDILTMWDVIEHIPDPVSLIKKFNPLWLFLSTPNLESVKGPIVDWRHYRPLEHIHYFDRFSLEVILDHAGYKIEEINYKEGELRDPQNPTAVISIAARRAS